MKGKGKWILQLGRRTCSALLSGIIGIAITWAEENTLGEKHRDIGIGKRTPSTRKKQIQDSLPAETYPAETKVDMETETPRWTMPYGDVLEEGGNAMYLESMEEIIQERIRLQNQAQGGSIDINKADKTYLESLLLLDPWQIQSLLHYRDSYGDILHPSELLLYIKGFDQATVQSLLPYLSFGKSRQTPLAKKKTHEILVRYGRVMKEAQAYKENRFMGSPDQYYLRYIFQTSGLEAGIAAQKDAGEKFRRQGFDSYTGYLRFEKEGILEPIILGCFRARIGWGLNLNQSGSFYRKFAPSQMTTLPQGLQTVASGAEYGFLQGMGLCLKLPRKWKVYALYSYRKRDATFSSPKSEGEQGYLSSIAETGYHRTQSESDRRDLLLEQIGGLAMEKTFARCRIGATASISQWGGIYNPENLHSRTPYRYSYLKPFRGGTLSTHYQLLVGKHHFYGEIAISGLLPDIPSSIGWASLQAWQWKPTEHIGCMAEVRHYSPGYFSPYSSCPNPLPLTQASRKRISELEWALESTMGRYWKLEILGGFARKHLSKDFPDRLYHISARTTASRPTLDLLLSLGYRHSLQRQGMEAAATIYLKEPQYLIAETRLVIRNRIESCAIAQDIGYRSPQGNLSVRMRLALFHSSDYQNRLYLYEHDVLYASGIPALYGKGCRINLVAKYELKQGIHLELKYGHTLYDQQTRMGSGDMEYQGFLKPEIRLQIRFNFRETEIDSDF